MTAAVSASRPTNAVEPCGQVVAERIQRPQRRELGLNIDCAQLPDPFGLAEILQPMRPKIAEPHSLGETIADQQPGRVRHEDLTSVTDPAQSRAADHGLPEVVALVTHLDLTRVHSNAHTETQPGQQLLASRAAATASVALANTATTESPSPCSTGRPPAFAAIAWSSKS